MYLNLTYLYNTVNIFFMLSESRLSDISFVLIWSFWSVTQNSRIIIKVRTFWEAHIIWKNLPHGFVKTMRKIFSNFVCFSESPNFNYLSKIRRYIIAYPKIWSGKTFNHDWNIQAFKIEFLICYKYFTIWLMSFCLIICNTV